MKEKLLLIMLSFFCLTATGQNHEGNMLLGDLNGDKAINVADVVILINKIKGMVNNGVTSPTSGVSFAMEDINKDGYVNETDLTTLVNIIMTGTTANDALKDLKGEELYEVMSNDLHSILSTHEDATIEDLQAELEKYPSSVTYEVKNNILYVYVEDKYKYMCDPYRITCPVSYGDVVIDNTSIEKMLGEINAALYPEGTNASVNVRTMDVGNQIKEFALTRGALPDEPIYLNRKNFFIWSPWPEVSTVTTEDPSPEHGETLEDLGRLKDYSIALLVCHGNEEGCIGVPKTQSVMDELGEKGLVEHEDFYEATVGSGEKAIVLNENALKKFLTGDLSKTIIFTAMCFGNVKNSVLKGVVESLGNEAFAGADNMFWMQGGYGQYGAQGLVNNFYSNPAFADNYVKRLLGAESANSPISKNYKLEYLINKINDKGEKIVEKKIVNGTYSFEYKKHFMYKPLTMAMSAINNQPRASVTMPYELFEKYHTASASRGAVLTRASSTSSISAGFWLRNKNTNEEMEIEFDQSTVIMYGRYDYEQVITRVELLGLTDDLKFGEYEYCTYIEIDGEKTYSVDIFEFTKEAASVSLSDFKITLIQHLDGQLYDNDDRMNYNYRFDASFTLAISDNEGVEDWGYYYITPAGKTIKKSLSKYGVTCDIAHTFYNNESTSTLKPYGYVKYLNSEEISYELGEYVLEYQERACPDGNHPHKIDLGLPSGTLWGCCNVGASKPEDYGKYYAWGETDEKAYYRKETYKWHDGSTYIVIGNDIAGTQYDVAHVEWKGSWKMPSDAQNRELWNNTSRVWETRDGIVGLKFVAPNGGTIFLPAAGWKGKNGAQTDLGYAGYYWSSTFLIEELYTSNARCLKFTKGNYNGVSANGRSVGQTIRPVY